MLFITNRALNEGNISVVNRAISFDVDNNPPNNSVFFCNKKSKNIYTVDCDEINNKYDSPIGHTYFLNANKANKPGVVFEHIYHAIDTGRVDSNGNLRNIVL